MIYKIIKHSKVFKKKRERALQIEEMTPAAPPPVPCEGHGAGPRMSPRRPGRPDGDGS